MRSPYSQLKKGFTLYCADWKVTDQLSGLILFPMTIIPEIDLLLLRSWNKVSSDGGPGPWPPILLQILRFWKLYRGNFFVSRFPLRIFGLIGCPWRWIIGGECLMFLCVRGSEVQMECRVLFQVACKIILLCKIAISVEAFAWWIYRRKTSEWQPRKNLAWMNTK